MPSFTLAVSRIGPYRPRIGHVTDTLSVSRIVTLRGPLKGSRTVTLDG